MCHTLMLFLTADDFFIVIVIVLSDPSYVPGPQFELQF